MLVIAGLGNPGSRYANNRHNIGYMSVDLIASDYRFSPWKLKFQGEIAEGVLGGEKTILLKPTTFMNDSGRSVGELLRFYKSDTADLVVIYDELDLPAGKVRIKAGGGHGGHNGIRSIEAHIGKNFRRMRLGIGHPGDKARVHGHVLGDFAKSDQDWLRALLNAVSSNAPLLASGDDSSFMNRVHLAMQPATGESASPKQASSPKPKAQSHIRQARAKPANAAVSGPMADLLKKLLGKTE
jgi:PTH1 family peptidyl-tRNA hydrolase